MKGTAFWEIECYPKFKCSKCGMVVNSYIHGWEDYKFCPRCGRLMIEKDNRDKLK